MAGRVEVVELVALRPVAPRAAAQCTAQSRAPWPVRSARFTGGVLAARALLPGVVEILALRGLAPRTSGATWGLIRASQGGVPPAGRGCRAAGIYYPRRGCR